MKFRWYIFNNWYVRWKKISLPYVSPYLHMPWHRIKTIKTQIDQPKFSGHMQHMHLSNISFIFIYFLRRILFHIMFYHLQVFIHNVAFVVFQNAANLWMSKHIILRNVAIVMFLFVILISKITFTLGFRFILAD